MKVSELIVTLNEFLEPCSSDFRVGNYFHSIPIGRVHVRGDRGTDTGDEDTEDEDTSAALFQAKRQERDLEQSFDSNPDSDGVDDWLEQRVRRARLLWQARLLMCESRNNITSMHAQSDEEVTEVNDQKYQLHWGPGICNHLSRHQCTYALHDFVCVKYVVTFDSKT